MLNGSISVRRHCSAFVLSWSRVLLIRPAASPHSFTHHLSDSDLDSPPFLGRVLHVDNRSYSRKWKGGIIPHSFFGGAKRSRERVSESGVLCRQKPKGDGRTRSFNKPAKWWKRTFNLRKRTKQENVCPPSLFLDLLAASLYLPQLSSFLNPPKKRHWRREVARRRLPQNSRRSSLSFTDEKRR